MFYKEINIILRKNTIRRSYNILKLLSSYFLSKIISYPIHWGTPMSISIEPTTACNLQCPECPSGLRSFNRPTGNLKFQQFRQFIDPFLSKLSGLIFYFQGEPYINVDLFKMIHYASSKGVYTMSSTNAHFLNEENCQKTIDSGLDRLIISIDGTTQESYEKYRIGGTLDKVIQGTKNLVESKIKNKSATPLIILQFLVVRHNEHQIEDIKKLAQELRVDKLELKTAQIYNYEQGSDLIPESQIYTRYRKQADGSFQIKNKLLNECWRMWQGCVITWDGKVVPCCFDKDASYSLGSLKEKTIVDVWNSSEYKLLRSQIIKGRKNIDICRNCTEGALV
ncbi:MAG: radical SAM/SPASM domain-containing protein [Saprospiraceae bacterium]